MTHLFSNAPLNTSIVLWYSHCRIQRNVAVPFVEDDLFQELLECQLVSKLWNEFIGKLCFCLLS